MEAKIPNFVESFGSFFLFYFGVDQIPWCDQNGNDTSDEAKNESIMRLSWTLVHSRHPEDVQRGLSILNFVQKRSKFYYPNTNLLKYNTLTSIVIHLTEQLENIKNQNN
ncbi:hypothetical protein MKX01_007792 [Papaver californicum]|nr:hypothetical protein MKX01_007792 [Papaver californicum]